MIARCIVASKVVLLQLPQPARRREFFVVGRPGVYDRAEAMEQCGEFQIAAAHEDIGDVAVITIYMRICLDGLMWGRGGYACPIASSIPQTMSTTKIAPPQPASAKADIMAGRRGMQS